MQDRSKNKRKDDIELEEGMQGEEYTIEGRNMVIEAFRSGKTVDKLYPGKTSEVLWFDRKSQCLVYTGARGRCR